MAKKIGAVNTIHNKNGKLIGYNTDAYGALASLQEKVKNIKGKKILILGSGGAARAIYSILKKQSANVIMLTIDISEAKKFGSALLLNNRNLKTQLAKADILINCTPVGMNEDKLQAGQYSVSASNRNFEGRQGKGGRTMLASPLTAAASAIKGKVADIRTMEWHQ